MLLDIALQATRIVLISFIILGTIGNVLNLLIFTRRTLLQSSCTLYLIAASIDNILVIYTSLLTRLLAGGFSDDVTTISNFMCKLRYYAGYVFFAVSPYFCVLACFDRYCSSSTSVTRRSWCNKKIAKRLIIAAIILACILYLHMAIFFQLNISGTSVSCYTQPGAYSLFYRLFYLVIYCLLPSVSMGVLCILTLNNILQHARRIRPALATGNDSLRRIDHQMIRMLFLQVFTQLLCVLPFAILNLVALFIDTTTIIYTFFSQIFILPLFVSYTTSFYVFTLSSRIYRKELMQIIWFWKRRQDENELTIGTVAINTALRQHQKTKPSIPER
jgi:hypothetical protein